jgi:hypothetical protein
MKNYMIFGIFAICIFFASPVFSEDDESQDGKERKVGDCPTNPLQVLATIKMKEVICSRTKAEDLAAKYNLELPKDWEWSMVDAWITGIRGFLKTSKFISCKDMESEDSDSTESRDAKEEKIMID